MVTTSNNYCQAQNKNGQPCQGRPGPSGYCFWHDPARAGQRKAASAKGGKRRHGRSIGPAQKHKPITLASVDDILKIVEKAINDCLKLENSLQRARTMGYLAGVAIKSFEVSELETRLAELERVVNEQQHRNTNHQIRTGNHRAGPI